VRTWTRDELVARRVASADGTAGTIPALQLGRRDGRMLAELQVLEISPDARRAIDLLLL
jgi:hypothetical protein